MTRVLNVGWRMWQNVDGNLYSLAIPYQWTPNVQRAVCKLDRCLKQHPIPSTRESSGFWAFTDNRSLKTDNDPAIVVGLIRTHGRIIYHERGHRAEFAQILALIRPPHSYPHSYPYSYSYPYPHSHSYPHSYPYSYSHSYPYSHSHDPALAASKYNVPLLNEDEIQALYKRWACEITI